MTVATDRRRRAPRYKVGKAYNVNGVWYYPSEVDDYVEEGIASWYGADFHDRVTANGDTYDMEALTAAHRTLPMPSAVEVTNLRNGRTLTLRVNDRGPFASDRIIDVFAPRRPASRVPDRRHGAGARAVSAGCKPQAEAGGAQLGNRQGRPSAGRRRADDPG